MDVQPPQGQVLAREVALESRYGAVDSVRV